MGIAKHTTTSFIDGRKTVAAGGTAEALSATSSKIEWVEIQAETDNTGVVVVGNSTVVASLGTRRGIALAAGERTVYPANDLNRIYIDVTVNGDGVTFTAGI
jgi:hypothetical protein